MLPSYASHILDSNLHLPAIKGTDGPIALVAA